MPPASNDAVSSGYPSPRFRVRAQSKAVKCGSVFDPPDAPPPQAVHCFSYAKYSSLGGGLVPAYVVRDHRVRWLGGLTCDFAECFREK
jgi:hypothetical protein